RAPVRSAGISIERQAIACRMRTPAAARCPSSAPRARSAIPRAAAPIAREPRLAALRLNQRRPIAQLVGRNQRGPDFKILAAPLRVIKALRNKSIQCIILSLPIWKRVRELADV